MPKLLTIEPKKPLDPDQPMLSYDTQVKLGGVELLGVAGVTVKYRAGDVARGEVMLEVYTGGGSNLMPSFHVVDPLTGAVREIERIIYAGGDEFCPGDVK